MLVRNLFAGDLMIWTIELIDCRFYLIFTPKISGIRHY
jgi:hypothetical protein